LRASSTGSGRSSRSSSVCQTRSTIAASRRSCRRRMIGSPAPSASSTSPTARSLSRIERRLASVGCAVKTGRTARARRASVRRSAPTLVLTSATASASQPCSGGRPASPRTRCTCSARFARWKYAEKARTSEIAVGSGASPSSRRSSVSAPGSSAFDALVSPRTRSTSSSSCSPSCRTSDSPSSAPTRRTSARSAPSGSPSCLGAGTGTGRAPGEVPGSGRGGSAGRPPASGVRSPSTRTDPSSRRRFDPSPGGVHLGATASDVVAVSCFDSADPGICVVGLACLGMTGRHHGHIE